MSISVKCDRLHPQGDERYTQKKIVQLYLYGLVAVALPVAEKKDKSYALPSRFITYYSFWVIY